MSTNSSEITDQEAQELAQFESRVLSELKPDAEDPVLEQAEGQAAEAETPAAAPPVAAPAAPAPAPATPETTQHEEPKGDVRAALRASRRAERLAREEAEQLRRRLEELEGGKAAPKGDVDDIEADLRALEVDIPPAAKVVRKLMQKIEKAAPSAAPAPAPEPAFVPVKLPPDFQEAVDANDTLSDWQHDPDQTRWNMAAKADALLSIDPTWANRPLSERFNEAVRIVNERLGSSQRTPSNAPAPAPVEIRSRGIETLSDLRGGVAPSNQGPDFASMKSDEEIMAALSRSAA